MAESMTESQAIEYASGLGLQEPDRSGVVSVLVNFPMACESRGMFADGILKAVARVRGPETAAEIQRNAGFPSRILGFRLYPHRDFYLLFYASAMALHPNRPLPMGMRMIAETFYPIFVESLAGRTMSALMGKTPRTVLERFIEAYKIAAPWNEHVIENASDKELTWRCKVEPCPYYPDTFSGICTGMVRTVTGLTPNFDIAARHNGQDCQHVKFRITW